MSSTTLIDTVLDRTVALGYGNVGLAIRRRLPGWPADPPPMHGRTVLITGAASGLGLAAARGFVRLGATVHVAARDEERAGEAARRVRDGLPAADVHPQVCDVASLASLRTFLDGFEPEALDVLLNNAGVMPDEREESPDGVELTFATNVLGPFALIDGLQDRLRAAAPARVINVSSGGAYAQSVPADDLETSDPDDYGPKKVYARTKRDLIVLTEQWAERLRGTGVFVHAMHPGWADTEGVQNWMPVFRALTRPIIRTPEQGADTIVWLGGAPEPTTCTGKFWHDRRTRPTHYAIGAADDSADARAAVWNHCADLLERSVTAPT